MASFTRVGTFPSFVPKTPSSSVSQQTRPGMPPPVPKRTEYRDGLIVTADEEKMTALQRAAKRRLDRAAARYAEFGYESPFASARNRLLGLFLIQTDVAYAPIERETLPADAIVEYSPDGQIESMVAPRDQFGPMMRNRSIEQAATLIKGVMKGRIKSASTQAIKSATTKGLAKAGTKIALSGTLAAATGGTSLAAEMALSLAIDKAGKVIQKVKDWGKPIIVAGLGAYSWLLIQMQALLAQLGVFGSLMSLGGFMGGFSWGMSVSGGNLLFGVASGFVGGFVGGSLASLGAGIATGLSSFVGMFTGSAGALFTFSASSIAYIGVSLGAIAVVTGAIVSQFAVSPKKQENAGPPTMFRVEKTASPQPVASLGDGFVARYNITIKPVDNQPLTIDSIIDETVAYTKSGPVVLSKRSINVVPGQMEYSYSVDISEPGLRNKTGVPAGAFGKLVAAKDFNIINTATVVGKNSKGVVQAQLGEAVIKVGNPVDEAPYDYPASGKITDVDDQSITVKKDDGSSKTYNHCGTVFFPDRSCLGGGLDIGAPGGSAVHSTLDGVVAVSTFDNDEKYGLGGVVYIMSMTGEYKAVFLHLGKNGLPTPGSVVKRGDVIGSVYGGDLPTTDGIHVHYQVLRGGANWNFANHVGACGKGNLLPSVPSVGKSVSPTTFPPATLQCGN